MSFFLADGRTRRRACVVHKSEAVRSNCNKSTAQATFIDTVKLLINAPGVYLNTDVKTPAFNRDPAFIGDPASIRTLVLSPLRL